MRTPFFINGRPETPAFSRPFHTPDQYLETAIEIDASDELLAWLDSPSGETSAALIELHHQAHGEVLMADCHDIGCRRDVAAIDRLYRTEERIAAVKGVAS